MSRSDTISSSTSGFSSSAGSTLAVAICTRDNERTIERTLRSVADLADRIIIVDSGSKDRTLEIGAAFDAHIIHRDWPGMISQRRFSLEQGRDFTWVLLLDSDESLEPEAREALRDTVRKNDPALSGWEINRKIWFLDGWLHHMYHPEWRLRLVRPAQARIAGTDPHDRVEVDGRVGRLRGIVRHDSWADVHDLVTRQIRHASEQAAAHSRGGDLWQILLSPAAAMFKQLILKRGILDGRRGLIAAGLTANYVMLKHAFAAERRLPARSGGATGGTSGSTRESPKSHRVASRDTSASTSSSAGREDPA